MTDEPIHPAQTAFRDAFGDLLRGTYTNEDKANILLGEATTAVSFCIGALANGNIDLMRALTKAAADRISEQVVEIDAEIKADIAAKKHYQ